MDHGQAVVLLLLMTTWLCDYSSRMGSGQRAAAIVAKRNGAILEFTCKISVDTLSIDYFFLQFQANFYSPHSSDFDLLVQLYIYHLYWTDYIPHFPVHAWIDTVKMSIIRFLLVLNLPTFLPWALETENGPSPGHSVLCSYSKTSNCITSKLPGVHKRPFFISF